MTQNQPDRLDRIEATLERVSQQLDNQVVVNAELRQAVGQLQQTVGELTSSVDSLIGIANQHQENFMVLVTEMHEIRTDMREMQSEIREMQSDIRGLQTENRRILGILEGLGNEE
ncbi:hypothetical protein [Nostoc sp. ChiQUE01b]|uniref:hypothetical protein n=1 Tax=Nostoc sp. ChiQUE01b TaxID=3075376 RepID=UPI002AD4B393|nr:hypothetical protein [Nostoc sp. ChiQUE01b]MDZ8262642.1 hypothetical protein [Nostoc sp. ChiQUE01b]